MTPAWEYDGWVQSGLCYPKFQESASRAVLGGSHSPLCYENGVFSQKFEGEPPWYLPPPPENAAKMVLSGWARRRRGGTVRIGLRDSSGPNCRCDRTPMVPMLHLDHRYPITFAFWTVRAGHTVGVASP